MNWGWSFSYRMIREEAAGEKKYGIHTTGADELKNLSKTGTDISNSTIYMPVSYSLMEKLLMALPGSRKHFVDIGCGKGRALCIAGKNGFERVSGIDFSPDFCAEAVRNLSKCAGSPPSFKYHVSLENAVSWQIPDDTDCLFMFNPFDDAIMEKVAEHTNQSLVRKPRLLHLIYVNPLHSACFTRRGFHPCLSIRTGPNLEATIYSNEKTSNNVEDKTQ